MNLNLDSEHHDRDTQSNLSFEFKYCKIFLKGQINNEKRGGICTAYYAG
jgi:hypothetical protein